MAVETLKTVTAQLELENGRDSSGMMTYVKQSIQYVRKDGYTPDRFLAITAALEPCITKGVGSANSIKTYRVTND